MPKPNVKFSMDESTWNEESSILARGPINAMSAWSVYGASKVCPLNLIPLQFDG